MRAFASILLAATLIIGPASASGERYERPGVGLSIPVPAGWEIVGRPLTPCTDPVQRLALRGHGALVQIQERVAVDNLDGYPQRPARFALPGAPDWIGCCVPDERKDKGWMLAFRDGGRGFYAYVFLGSAGTRGEALSILDGLRVRPRPA